MKKKGLPEKIKEKLINKISQNKGFEQSWAIHMQAFGPILEPAFADNAEARILLVAALNILNKRDVKGCLKKLEDLREMCQTNDDHAAVLYFTGLCYEFAGMKDHMVSYYSMAAKFEHKFYLPYLKTAKAAHEDAVFDFAKTNYLSAIKCLENMPPDPRYTLILASAYTNFASCLTMMHKYEEASKMLTFSKQVQSYQDGRAASEAVLWAAQNDAENCRKALSELEQQAPKMYKEACEMTEKILSGKHPQFSPIEIEAEHIKDFWEWFSENENVIINNLQNENYDELFAVITTRLKIIFPFINRDPEFAFNNKDCKYEITFADFYMVSMKEGYQALIEHCPNEIASRWDFVIEH